MKLKHISALIVLVLIAFTSVSTVIAQLNDDYYPSCTVGKKAQEFIFTIDTTSDTNNGPFDGTTVDESTIVITVFEKKGKNVLPEITLASDSIELQQDNITITCPWKEVPRHCDSYNIVGTLDTGETFYATGPAWGWGGFHK
jgi:hypothetical protein